MFFKKKKCPICGRKYKGNGYYALPILDGHCCYACSEIVTKARVWNIITSKECNPALLVIDGYKDAHKEYYEAALFAYQHGLYILGTITINEIMAIGLGTVLGHHPDYLCVNDFITKNPEGLSEEYAVISEDIEDIGYKVHVMNQ